MSSTFTKASQIKLKIDRLERVFNEIGHKLPSKEYEHYSEKLQALKLKLTSILGVK